MPSTVSGQTGGMNRKVNDAQLAVLRWVSEGSDTATPVTPTFKTTASALSNRKLVTIDRRRGRWHASLTELGAYYL